MKKNFFKKLSFVLALAMIVTALAPAAGAFAAKAPKLSASTKYLYLDRDGGNEYDFNISNKVKGWKYLWSSANEDVAEVNAKNGVTTATGAGKTTISVVITDKDGEEFEELTATVVVRDNIKELTITNLPTDGKVAVGVAHDFNRSYVTEAKKTKGTSGITRWAVDSKDASITDMGVFTATKAGEYTITARAFQSKAKYASWLLDATKYESYVTAETTYKVTVANSATVKQLSATKAELTFASAVTKEDVLAKLTVNKIVGVTPVKQTIKEVKMNADGKVATVEMYSSFAASATYTFVYTGNDKVAQFIGATAKTTDVVSVEFVTSTATVSTATDVVVKLLNADGVDIATIDPTLLNRVTMTSSSAKAYLNTSTLPNEVTMYTIGDTTTITAVYHATYKYDTATGTEMDTITSTGLITCVAVAANPVTSIKEWTLATSAPASFTTVNHVISASDTTGMNMYVNTLKADGTTYVSNSSATATNVVGPAAFRFSSSDSSVLIVTTAGQLYPVKAGAANVIVEYTANGTDYTIIEAVPVTVSAARVATTLDLSSYAFTLSNSSHASLADTKTVTIEVKDQYGVKMAADTVTLTEMANSYNGTDPITAGGQGAVASLTFNGAGRTAGTYTYSVATRGLTRYVVVTVSAPLTSTGAAATSSSSYKLSVDSTFDAKATTTVSTNVADLKVLGYAANGVAYEALNPAAVTAANMELVLVDTTGAEIVEGTAGTAAGTFDVLSVSGGTTLVKAKSGTYTVKLFSISGATRLSLLDQVTFTVTDTQVAPTVTNTRLVTNVTVADIDAVVANCFSVTTTSGNTVAFAALTADDYIGTFVTGVDASIFIKNVRVTETIAGKTYTHVIAVNTLVTVD